MTGVSTLNMVVQQGGSAQEMLHPRQHSVEHAQVMAAQQEAAREEASRGKVLEAAEAEKSVSDHGRGRRERRPPPQNKKRNGERLSSQPGSLLDTLA